MLSRTADHLFWMSRYTERAENTARMLSVIYENSLLPQSAKKAKANWDGVLSISELQRDYASRYESINAKGVLDFMVRDLNNPSSIISCLKAARENARAVRGTITTEVWETNNQTWIEVGRLLEGDRFTRDPVAFFEWVKHRSHLARGVVLGTMLRDDAFRFIRLGIFLERADNTARLLDVKFHGVKNDFYGRTATDNTEEQPEESDFYHWSSLLRSVSALEIYRKVYRDAITPDRVADLLILRKDMPRSLHASLSEVSENLTLLANEHSAETERKLGRMVAELQYSHIDEIVSTGLHAFLTHFLDRVSELGAAISRDFLVPVDE